MIFLVKITSDQISYSLKEHLLVEFFHHLLLPAAYDVVCSTYFLAGIDISILAIFYLELPFDGCSFLLYPET